jgi:hypothetical protein
MNENCAICLEEINTLDKCGMKKCNHHFHSLCIHTWVEKNKNKLCPLCRTKTKLLCNKNDKRSKICNDLTFKFIKVPLLLLSTKRKRKKININRDLEEIINFMLSSEN